MRATLINNRPAIVIGDTEHMLTESEAHDVFMQLSIIVKSPDPCKYCEGSLKHEANSKYCGQCGKPFNEATDK